MEGAFGGGAGAFGAGVGVGTCGGQLSVTNPMCSPSIGTNPLSLNPSSTACRERKRDSPCSLYGPASSITASRRTCSGNVRARS